MLNLTSDVINRVAAATPEEQNTISGLSGITITAQREAVLDFTTPYYTTRLALLLPNSVSTSSVEAIWKALKSDGPPPQSAPRAAQLHRDGGKAAAPH